MNDRLSAGARIMVVDDIPQNLTLLQDMLRKHGYQVFVLPNGEMALKAAQDEFYGIGAVNQTDDFHLMVALNCEDSCLLSTTKVLL